MKLTKLILLLLCLFVSFHCPIAIADEMKTDGVRFTYDERGVFGIASPQDPYGAQVTSSQRPLTLVVRYRVGQGEWQDLNSRQSRMEASAKDGVIQYTFSDPAGHLRLVQRFTATSVGLDWDIELETSSDKSVTIGDLVNLPGNGHAMGGFHFAWEERAVSNRKYPIPKFNTLLIPGN
jgi:hypothetical protein